MTLIYLTHPSTHSLANQRTTMWTRKRLVFDMKRLADANVEKLAMIDLLNSFFTMVSAFQTQSK